MTAEDPTDEIQPAGPLLDALGVTIELAPHQQIVEAVVLAKIIDFDNNTTGMAFGASNGCDWVSQRGMIAAAQHILDHDCECRDG